MTTLIGPTANGAETLARTLLAQVDALTDDLAVHIKAADAAYAESALLTDKQLRAVVYDNLTSVLGQLAGLNGHRLHPAIAAGRIKAELGLPLAAVLHAYRLAGRLIWDKAVAAAPAAGAQDALPQLASEVWRIIDDYSDAATDAYGSYLVERAERDRTERQAMLRALFDGELDGFSLREAVRVLHLPQSGTFHVIHAEASDQPTDIDERLRSGAVQSASLHKSGAIVSLTEASSLDRVVTELQRCVTGRIGVSRPFTNPIHAANAAREAELACRCAPPLSIAVTTYGSTPIPLLLAHAPTASRELADTILRPVLDLPRTERDVLLDTLDLWFDCGGSNIEVAQRLNYHRNTVHYRLRRIEELTGRRCSDPKAAAELYIALRAARLSEPTS